MNKGVAIAKESFDYIFPDFTGFHVHNGNAYIGIFDKDGDFHFVIYVGPQKKRTEVYIPKDSQRFTFHYVANETSDSDNVPGNPDRE